jgi:glycosyltransferase involved in cell wall biosynthesis
MFSVVVNAYNRESTISDTLISIINQTLKASEIIVVNDGSTDNTEAIIKRFESDVIVHTIKNVGCGASRKFGVDQSKSVNPWIAFCDSDDIWQPDHLEELARVISFCPNASVVATDFHTFGDSEPDGYHHFQKLSDDWRSKHCKDMAEQILQVHSPYLALLQYNPIFPSSCAVNRKLYNDAGGINPDFSRIQAEDTDIIRRMAMQPTYMALSTKSTLSMRRDGSNMSANQAYNLLGRAIISQSHIDDGYVPAEYQDATNAFIHSSALETCRRLYTHQDSDGFIAAYKLIKHAPNKALRFRKATYALPLSARRYINQLFA